MLPESIPVPVSLFTELSVPPSVLLLSLLLHATNQNAPGTSVSAPSTKPNLAFMEPSTNLHETFCLSRDQALFAGAVALKPGDAIRLLRARARHRSRALAAIRAERRVRAARAILGRRLRRHVAV